MTERARKPRSGKSVDEILKQVEDDLQDVVEYLNGEVVPHVRTHSTRALRTAARKLSQLADYMDDARRGSR